MKDLKYTAAFLLPISAAIGMYFKGYYTFTTPVFAFLIIPILEIILPQQNANLSSQESSKKSTNILFDILLYLNLPIVFMLLFWFFKSLSITNYSTYELTGLLISLGVVLGANGVNVGHELGHRKKRWEIIIGQILLMPSMYMHFYIEHNFGHHLHAATKEDPATARYNQSLYSFWVTSISRQYKNAWLLQLKLLKQKKASFISIYNNMLWALIFQSLYLLAIYFVFGLIALGCALCIALISILLLESINYIEHYGLLRKRLPSGRYERVSEIHSWNSNHSMGRIILYELTRHSDHHHRAHKKYQLLDCHETSPQMPFGYPTSMVLSMVPPLWFFIMNKRIPLQMRS